jgi:hypothetical protein
MKPTTLDTRHEKALQLKEKRKINWSENEDACDPDFGRAMLIGLLKCVGLGFLGFIILLVSGYLMMK